MLDVAYVKAIRKEADDILLRDFDLPGPKTPVRLHRKELWAKIKPDANTLGYYSVMQDLAELCVDHPNWIATYYHEVHGHATYYGRSLLVKGKQNLYDHKPFPEHLQEWGLPGTQWHNSEAFATWMASYLCQATGRDHLWRSTKMCMPPAYRDAYDAASDCVQRLSPPGFLRQMGIDIPIDTKRAESIVRALSNGNRIDLAAYVPSVDTTAPVQALLVSDARISAQSEPWLAPRILSTEQFIAQTKTRDLANELSTSTFLFGDAYAWERARQHCASRRSI